MKTKVGVLRLKWYKLLIDEKLVACAQISKIESFYNWDNELQKEEEYQLSLKTKKENYKQIENLIIKNSSYEVPQIIAILIQDGFKDYLSWIDKNSIKNKV